MLILRSEFDAALVRHNVARNDKGWVPIKGHIFVAFGGEYVEVDNDAMCLIDGQWVQLLSLPLCWECPAILIYAD